MMEGNSGKIVETKTGKRGYVYNNRPIVNGKVAVYLINDDSKLPILCAPDSLKIVGFFD